MRFLLITLLMVMVCPAQNRTEKNLGKIAGIWALVHFEEVESDGKIYKVKTSGIKGLVLFDFKENQRLEVVYPSGATENYLYVIDRNRIQIIADAGKANHMIYGKFDIHFVKNHEVFLEREKLPHHGIRLSRH